ncbi:serine/threonine-protein kinase [Pontiella sulfatireligans]|uniref:Serine/threonine-protein kinase PknD n=1 Tax=Pontiella sulfatireligans TaxID=2750658 RepID=A0A6C2UF76_9BACT|nr:serine/threonine-protein kinase [Pontiella sulfatireligans]VGO18533.1 Serine/threonine-protein kinase PknD [Pontiella sulfatireligans]
MSEKYKQYKPDPRLSQMFDQAARRDDEVLELICPSFLAWEKCAVRYEQQELLGRGGLKEVFRAYDCKMKRWVALAKLREDRGLQYYELFVHEAQLIGSMSHPNIIKVYDADTEASGRPFFSMTLKGESNLANLLQSGEVLSRSSLLDIFLKVCDAMAYAHSVGVVHLDLKPENIQCDQFGEVVVCDWGLGRCLTCGDPEANLDSLSARFEENGTLFGRVQGTLGYMAPEQIQQDLAKNERTDIYALGCVLHTILCGEPPFQGTVDEVFDGTVCRGVESLCTRFPERRIPESLDAVVLKATRRDPNARYASVLQIQQEIRSYLGGFSTDAEDSGFFKEAALFIGRNKVSSSITLAAFLLLTVLSVLFIQRLGQQRLVAEEERKHAQALRTEVTVLSEDYKAFSEKSEIVRRELAEELTVAVSKLIRSSMFSRPVPTVAQASQMLEVALQLDPECAPARKERFKLNFLMLNFKEVIKETDYFHEASLKLANAFPDYEFGPESRPTSEQMIAVLHAAEPMHRKLAGPMEQLYAYYCARSKPQSGRASEVEALLAFYNGGNDHFSMTVEKRSNAVHIHCDQEALHFLPKKVQSGHNLLRFIPIRDLKITTTGKVLLAELSHPSLTSFDFSECPNLVVDRTVYTPRLSKVVVPRGSRLVSSLKKHIQSDVDVAIIEVDR